MGVIFAESGNVQRIKLAVSCVILLVLLNIGLVINSRNKIERIIAKVQYDEVCLKTLDTTEACVGLLFSIKEELKGPFNVYYQIKGFYEHYKQELLVSIDEEQLGGKFKTIEEVTGQCTGVVTNSDLYENQRTSYLTDVALSNDVVSAPCGFLAKSIPTDTYEIKYSNQQPVEEGEESVDVVGDDSVTELVPITLIKRSRFSDEVLAKYKNFENKDQNNQQWANFENADFIEWMETSKAMYPRKLWGTIENDFKPGTYNLHVMNKFDSRKFIGKKYLVVTMPITESQEVQQTVGVVLVVIALVMAFVTLVLICVHRRTKYDEDDEYDKTNVNEETADKVDTNVEN